MLNNSPSQRVALIDDHALSRRGLSLLLNELPNVTLIGEAANGEEGISMILETLPDVAIIDIVLPGKLSGYGVASEIRKRLPNIKIILITGTEDALRPVDHCFSDGLIHKEDSFEELEACLVAVSSDRHFVSKAIRIRLDLLMTQNKRLSILSPREQEVILLIAEGRTDKETAEQLGVSEHTVRTHRTRIRKKLGVRNTAELTRAVLSGTIGQSENRPV